MLTAENRYTYLIIIYIISHTIGYVNRIIKKLTKKGDKNRRESIKETPEGIAIRYFSL